MVDAACYSFILPNDHFNLQLLCLFLVSPPSQFFAGRELVTVFSAPNYCGEFDNAGAMMTVDDTLMCSFQILKPASASQQRGGYGRPGTPNRR